MRVYEEPVEQVEVPPTAEVNWDAVMEKISRAREGHSDPAPISNAPPWLLSKCSYGM
jgi:hypothetical protein